MNDPYKPSVTAHTMPLDRLDQVRHLTRELDRLLGKLQVSHLSMNAADLIEAARASNAATRTLLRHANLPLEQSAPGRCRVHLGTELCDVCGMVLSLCVCEDR